MSQHIKWTNHNDECSSHNNPLGLQVNFCPSCLKLHKWSKPVLKFYDLHYVSTVCSRTTYQLHAHVFFLMRKRNGLKKWLNMWRTQIIEQIQLAISKIEKMPAQVGSVTTSVFKCFSLWAAKSHTSWQRWDCRNIVLLKAIFTSFLFVYMGEGWIENNCHSYKKNVWDLSNSHLGRPVSVYVDTLSASLKASAKWPQPYLTAKCHPNDHNKVSSFTPLVLWGLPSSHVCPLLPASFLAIHILW